MASIKRQGHELIAQVAAKADAAEVPHNTAPKWCTAPETILQTEQERRYNLIILGSCAVIISWKRLMIGRTLNAVPAKSLLPVMIVKRFLVA